MLDRRAFVTVLLASAWAPAALAACGSSATDESAEEEQPNTDGISNPFIDCESAAEVAKIAGFEVTFPEAVPGYSERHYQAIEGAMAQCFYVEGDQRVLIRKGTDDGSGDLSGDYNEYAQTETVQMGDAQVTLRGEGDLAHVAIWERDGYLFAIDADAGLDRATIENLVSATF